MGAAALPALMIGQTAVAGAQALTTASAARRNTRAVYGANARNLELLREDRSRQIEEADTAYREAVSDRVLRANQEIAVTELMALERGSSGSTMDALVRQLATIEGIDLSRIEGTRNSRVAAIDSQIRSANQAAADSNTQAFNQGRTQVTQSILNFAGSGLQIGTKAALMGGGE